MFLAFIFIGKHHTYFIFLYQNKLRGGDVGWWDAGELMFFAFYRPNGYVIHYWDF